jgi:lysozyme
MLPENRKKLRDLITGSETYKQFPYNDTTGHLTIGIGRNLYDRGVSLNEALTMLDNDILYFTARLDHNIDYFSELDDIRKMVLISMCFNCGVLGLLKFTRMLEALKNKDYETAANEILDSKAHAQTGYRYEVLADMMRTGEMSNGH